MRVGEREEGRRGVEGGRKEGRTQDRGHELCGVALHGIEVLFEDRPMHTLGTWLAVRLTQSTSSLLSCVFPLLFFVLRLCLDRV